MIFFRIYNNNLYSAGEVDQLGFSINDPSYIPDEYLESGAFVLLRTCFGIGDWGIISAIPRKLKEKYPDCKVYLPSKFLLERWFGSMKTNWGSWSDPFDNIDYIFQNNPYIDGRLDTVGGEIYHDHFRIYDKIEEPLARQMLRFWQFEEDETQDVNPELYFSDDEQKRIDRIITYLFGSKDAEYGGLLISNRYEYDDDEAIIERLHEYDLPYVYYTKDPIAKTPFSFIDHQLNIRNMGVRDQLLLRCRAKVNIGNHCGMLDSVAGCSKVYTAERQFPMGCNFVESETYISNKKNKNSYENTTAF